MKKFTVIFILCAMVAAVVASCHGGDELEFRRHYNGGMLLYQTNCQNCHGKNGEGLSSLIPPLTDTAYISKNKNKLACFVQNGVSGTMIVGGKFYDNKMPPSGLSRIDIAKVLTYVGNSFGNKAGLINVEAVTKHLENCE